MAAVIGSVNCSDSAILKNKTIRVSERLNTELARRGVTKDFKDFALRNYQVRVAYFELEMTGFEQGVLFWTC